MKFLTRFHRIRCLIFSFLPPLELALASVVCRDWHDTLINTGVDTSGGELIWKTIYLRHFGGPRKSNQSWFVLPFLLRFALPHTNNHPIRKQATVSCEQQFRKLPSHERTFRWSVAGGHHRVLAMLLDEHPEWRGEQLDFFPGEKSNSPPKLSLPYSFPLPPPEAQP